MKDSLLQGIVFVLNLWSGLAFHAVDLKKKKKYTETDKIHNTWDNYISG